MAVTPALIGLDWGTTSLRAYLIGADGAVAESSERKLGILQVANGDFTSAFAGVTAAWRKAHGALPALASGMIGSRQGWREAPYAECPAGLREIARNLLAVEGADLRIVPGVTMVDADGIPDVMRGEETQIFGAFGANRDGVAVLPGTHSKWAIVEAGRIARFATFMTGEVFAALCDHTILGRLMTARNFHAHGFARGIEHAARDAKGRGGLLHRLFSARTRGLFESLPAGLPGDAVHSYLSGLAIGSEIAEAGDWLERRPARVTIIGAQVLAGRYETALRACGIVADAAPPDAAARGLFRIAGEAGAI